MNSLLEEDKKRLASTGGTIPAYQKYFRKA